MPHRKISAASLIARIDTLRRRHREIDNRIDTEQIRPAPDITTIRQLKKERLGLRDAIRVTQTILARIQPSTPQTG